MSVPRLYHPPNLSQCAMEYPVQPIYHSGNQINQRFKSLPDGSPYPPNVYPEDPNQPSQWSEFTNEIVGPASLKSLQSGPNYYPNNSKCVPANTMYKYEMGELGFGGKRESYHRPLFPFHHRHVREIRDYSKVLPYPDIKVWQTKPVTEITPGIKTTWGNYGENAH